MIEGSRRLPWQHITIRVPWHDGGWNGRACIAPSANTSCLVLRRIASAKRDEQDGVAGKLFDELAPSELPPCIDERVGFMCDHDLVLTKQHPYKLSSPKTHGHFGETKLRIEAYSAACIPFGWMLKSNVEGNESKGEFGKATTLRLAYDPEREPDLSFETGWVQDKTNQLIMLDTFFGALQPKTSLCFFYAKKTPLSESANRVIIGAARVNGVGEHTEYVYEAPGDLKGVLWERCVRHSLRPGGEDGFLMPYYEVLATAQADASVPIEDCVAFAPEEQFDAFSYGSEHLGHDGAIASLLACAAALRATAKVVEIDVSGALAWIDREIARLWKARGVHPGLGSALSAFGLEHGSLLAHEIVRVGSREGAVFDGFAFIDGIVKNPSAFPQAEKLGFGSTYRDKWKSLAPLRRQLLDLVARCSLSADQALRAYQPSQRGVFTEPTSDADLLANPYLLYERDETAAQRIAFGVVDRGVFPADVIREIAPLPAQARMTDGIDKRRVRALISDMLEHAVQNEGHTLLPRSWIVSRATGAPLDPRCVVDEDVIDMVADYLALTLETARTSDDELALKLRRYGASRTAITSAVHKRVGGKRHSIVHKWRALVDAVLPPMEAGPEAEVEELARREKSGALEQLACGRFSVLIGPAGSGKTTLLKVLCDLPEISSGGILLLAPTGKARVRLEEATKRLGEGQTLAQFLQRYERYDGASGRYFRNPKAPREKGYRSVIVDECSMLTEDQLSALIDAIEGVDRLILVGDPRQLPPIGAGRPFVDICRKLAPSEETPQFPKVAPGYAELTIIGRQRGTDRGDVLLARQFSGEPLDAGADEVWEALRSGTLSHVRTAHWALPSDLEPRLTDEIVRGLALADRSDQRGFELSIGGSEWEGHVLFWERRADQREGGAAEAAHDWQILSPVRAGAPGVEAINLAIQRRFRNKVRERALTPNAKYPKPAGPQGILWGDKVINLRNNGRRRTYPRQEKPYVANGDIGIVVGGYKRGKMKFRPRDLEVEFASQPGVKFTYYAGEFSGEEGTPELELAYALTIHKTQGSQFERTFVVLPRHCRPLSRELLYTALTRHQEELNLLHEDDIGALRRYSDPSASEIARRMTDLFDAPGPVEVKTVSGPRFLDKHLLHRTSRGEFVRSKSELAIAEKLNGMGIGYVYEQPLQLDGKTRWPDFTITDEDSGITYYWEHLGMLSDPQYAARWQIKRSAYLAAGIRPIGEQADGDVLIETREDAGVGLDMVEVDRLARLILR
ncbi:ATP-dependent DNA helicase [Rhodopseudomonas palustris]|uniref:AAA family ATPase n=1 Tax=Rhodopseudomonas palustris (strain ATCC BAA-98 / CGA009) TaxID=258594 RepID=Q6N7J7_RHOPA|nr:AAA family ATPase [Rhodopseudomonas palustris]OPF90466.1 RNA helicase [Rhodopseudomonas palustris]PPQ42946.1 RNA helicase [Rhodopseudomonas palustris]QQM03781.1 ATP-dependent RecD-like DNA helicase [Rhodopseudomonas palustris]RJF61852.1 RNA helicase [Rhodopseudomonas palustris]WAB79920.1 AAA family ATPase [Rhodopseudomonas palustris]